MIKINLVESITDRPSGAAMVEARYPALACRPCFWR